MAKKDEIERDYTDNVGHPPHNLSEDDPDLWQWRYVHGRDMTRLEALIEKPPEPEQLGLFE